VPVYGASSSAPVYGASSSAPVYGYPTSAPVYGVSSSAPVYGVSSSASVAKPMSTPSSGNGYPAQPNAPSDVKKQQEKVTSTTVSIVYVTKTPIPMVSDYSTAVVPSSYVAVPYPSGAASGSGSYPTKPTGTGVPTKPSSYVPPAQFTGAASRVGAGMGAFVAIFAAVMVL
jgi:chitinase